MQLSCFSEQFLGDAVLLLNALPAPCSVGSGWQQACLLTVGSWHLLLSVPTGERLTTSCKRTPYDAEDPVTCCSAGQEVQLAEAQKGARPE